MYRFANGEVYDGEWQLVSYDPATQTSRWIAADAEVPNRFHVRTTQPKENLIGLFERNKQLYNESMGKRWGDGQVAYSMPTDEYFRSGMAEAKKQDDKKWQRKFLNDPDNRKYRSFKGNL
jgi:hypothetical protein